VTRYQAVIVALLVVAGIGWILRPDHFSAALSLFLAVVLVALELAAVSRSRR
jgi:hypothetical protein